MGDGARLDREKRTAPTKPPAAKSDPKYSIEGGQNRALAFSLAGCEWEAERGILESDGWVTAHQQPEENGREIETELAYYADCGSLTNAKSTCYEWMELWQTTVASGPAGIAAIFDQLSTGSLVALPDDCCLAVAGLAKAVLRGKVN
jgi:hypothetical protein